MNSVTKALFKNIASLSVVQIGNYILPLISVPIVSRIIGPEKFGILSFAASFVGYFVLFISYGFDLTATRKITKSSNDVDNRNNVFNQVLWSQIILLAISSIIFFLLVNIIHQLKNEKIVAYFSFIICFATVITQNWLFQAMQELHKVALFNLISKVLFTILILLAVKSKSDYIWQPLIWGACQMFVSTLSFIWSVKRYNVKLFLVSPKVCFQVLWEDKMVFLSLMLVSLYTTTNIIILGIFQDFKNVGYFTSAQRLISIIQSVIALPLAQSLYPFIGKKFGESYIEGITVVQKLFPYILILTGFIGCLIFLFAPTLISIFYGSEFLPAINILRVLAFIPMIISISNLSGIQVMLNLRMDKAFFNISFIGASISILSNLFLVRILGEFGTAINWLLTELFICSSFLYILYKKNIMVFQIEKFSMKNLYSLINNQFKYRNEN